MVETKGRMPPTRVKGAGQQEEFSEGGAVIHCLTSAPGVESATDLWKAGTLQPHARPLWKVGKKVDGQGGQTTQKREKKSDKNLKKETTSLAGLRKNSGNAHLLFPSYSFLRE